MESTIKLMSPIWMRLHNKLLMHKLKTMSTKLLNFSLDLDSISVAMSIMLSTGKILLLLKMGVGSFQEMIPL